MWDWPHFQIPTVTAGSAIRANRDLVRCRCCCLRWFPDCSSNGNRSSSRLCTTVRFPDPPRRPYLGWHSPGAAKFIVRPGAQLPAFHDDVRSLSLVFLDCLHCSRLNLLGPRVVRGYCGPRYLLLLLFQLRIDMYRLHRLLRHAQSVLSPAQSGEYP
jgi:hypothetical protein